MGDCLKKEYTKHDYRIKIFELLRKIIEQNEEIRKLEREIKIYKKMFIKEVENYEL